MTTCRYGSVSLMLCGGVKTRASVEAQLDHAMDMLQLSRSDNLGVRHVVPALMLRLNRDQECCDFVEWWSTTGNNGDYDWGNMKSPYLDIKNDDVFEPVEYLCNGWNLLCDLSHVVAVTLLKIKLLLDLTALQNSAAVGEKGPREILGGISGRLCRALSSLGTKISWDARIIRQPSTS